MAANAFLEAHGYCMCATNRTKLMAAILPVVEMFKVELEGAGSLGWLFVSDHLDIYFDRMDDCLRRGLHMPGYDNLRSYQGGSQSGDVNQN